MNIRTKFSLIGGGSETSPPPDVDMPCVPSAGQHVTLRDGSKWEVLSVGYEISGSSATVIVDIKPKKKGKTMLA